MPTVPKVLITEGIYHVFNRGVEKRIIFPDSSYYERFLTTLDYYQKERQLKLSSLKENVISKMISNERAKEIASVLCFCLMPNHFHLVLKQLVSGGISKFMNDISNSYTRYLNTRTERVGPLFQGTFKAKALESDESFLQATRYIHLNPTGLLPNLHPEGGKLEKRKIAKFLENYPYSSYGVYLRKSEKRGPCERHRINNLLNTGSDYREFAESKIGQDASLGIENLIIEG